MSTIEPIYQQDGITLYQGDNREVLPQLEVADLLLTDPPYGIGQDKGMGSGGRGGFGNCSHRAPRRYQGDWDATRPDNLSLYLSKAHTAIIWGGNHFSDQLPQCNKWLVWNKEQTMPSYSDCELAWTNLNGNAIKMFTYAGNGFFAREKERWHPTQKPIALMNWCLDVAHMEEGWTILDPFLGSGSSLVAAKARGLHGIGIEREEKYIEIAIKRLSQTTILQEINLSRYDQ